MYFLVGYDHSMTKKEAEERSLPAEVRVVLSEDRGAGLDGDTLRPWQIARNPDSIPPDQLFMFVDKPEWTVDFFTIYGGVVVSERFLSLVNKRCADSVHVSHLTIINDEDRELKGSFYFIKFTTVADVLDFDRLDFGGAYHHVIGGANELSEDEQGASLVKRAAGIAFIDEKPALFLEGNLPEIMLPLFCDEAFKSDCEQAGMRGPCFWPESELLVVDFSPGWGDQFKEVKPQLVTRAQRSKWNPNVERSHFYRPEGVQLSPEHQRLLKAAAERMKHKR